MHRDTTFLSHVTQVKPSAVLPMDPPKHQGATSTSWRAGQEHKGQSCVASEGDGRRGRASLPRPAQDEHLLPCVLSEVEVLWENQCMILQARAVPEAYMQTSLINSGIS